MEPNTIQLVNIYYTTSILDASIIFQVIFISILVYFFVTNKLNRVINSKNGLADLYITKDIRDYLSYVFINHDKRN